MRMMTIPTNGTRTTVRFHSPLLPSLLDPAAE